MLPSPNVTLKPTGHLVVQIRYLGSPCKYLHSVYHFRSTVYIKCSWHKKKKWKISIFSKNGSNDFDQIFCIYSTLETKRDTIDFFRENLETRKLYFFKFSVWMLPNIAPKTTYQSRLISRVLLHISRNI